MGDFEMSGSDRRGHDVPSGDGGAIGDPSPSAPLTLAADAGDGSNHRRLVKLIDGVPSAEFEHH
jgi:hypothetical protein